MNFLLYFIRLLLYLLESLVREPWGFLLLLIRRLRGACAIKHSRKQLPCLPLPPDIVRKPDPLIYCQSYLQSLGIAVTWDNPDIQIQKAGAVVNPHDLLPDTDYDVAITVHNGSNEAPAPATGVQLWFRDWGIAGPWTFASQGSVDLPVRGASGEPASIRLPWHTPASGGHFCLMAVLQHANDLNPANNFGQTNTDIRRAAHAGEMLSFDIPVMHMLPGRRALRLQLTSYRLPESPLFPPLAKETLDRYDAAIRQLGEKPSFPRLLDAAGVTGAISVDNWSAFRLLKPSRPGKKVSIRQFAEDWMPHIVKANSPQTHAAPTAWRASLSVERIELEPNSETNVRLLVYVPAGTPRGTLQPFQVNALDDLTGLVGGVEVVVAVE
jgi:hypothetical protein